MELVALLMSAPVFGAITAWLATRQRGKEHSWARIESLWKRVDHLEADAIVRSAEIAACHIERETLKIQLLSLEQDLSRHKAETETGGN